MQLGHQRSEPSRGPRHREQRVDCSGLPSAIARALLAELRKHRDRVKGLLRQRAAEQQNWPPASLDAERRFGQPHAKLFPFLGRKVRTPAGAGTLLQVFAERVTVLLDSELSRCSFFRPIEIEPVSWEIGVR